jgi:AraC family transcriptional activator of mtrCDE
MDWLSRLLDLMPVSGRLDVRCSYGAPWRIEYEPGSAGVIWYHVVLAGAAVFEASDGGAPLHLSAGDILLLPSGSAHVLHDGSGKRAAVAHYRDTPNTTISENVGTGARLDMLCGHFEIAPPYDRLVRGYLPAQLVVQSHAPDESGALPATGAKLAGLVGLMRAESGGDSLGGHAMLNALSAALFTLTLRLASESAQAPAGLLALAGHPRLAPALAAMFNEPARAWTLPELAGLCNMSRATLARQFQSKVGRSASDLLTDIRMALAVNALKNPRASTEAVAETVGYQSVSAFKRAFKQRLGVTPADWRRGWVATKMG